MSSSRYYGQLVQKIEYNPRLFLILLIWACVVVFSYQFASLLISQWMMAGLALIALVASVLIVVWPFHAVMVFLLGAGVVGSFIRGGTMMGLSGALVYPGDVFTVAFFVLEFFRGCTRQTRLYTTTDRWMLAMLVWTLVCVVRGLPDYKHSAYGEARDFTCIIAYFIAIHYVTKPEQIPSVLKWLKFSCVVTWLAYFKLLIQSGYMTRFAGGILGLYVVFTVIALAVLLGRDHIKRYRTLAVWFLIGLVVLILYSAARSVVLSMVVTVPFLLWITRRHFIKTVIVGLIAVVCALWFVALMDPVLGGKLIPFMEKSYQGIIKPAEDPTGSWRFYGWRWEMEKIFSNPFWVLIGQGFGGYYEWFFSYHDEIIRTAPHNFYVQLWSKMGLLGLGLFCAAFFSFYVQAFRFLRRSRNDLHRSVIMVFMLSLLSALAAMVAGHAPAGVWVLAALGTTLTRLWLLEAEASPPSVIGVNLPWAKSSVGLRSPGGPLAAAMSGAAKTK